MAWNIEIDEAMFLGGLDKSAFCASSSRTFSSTTKLAIANRPAS
jgi:5''-nucleotidase.